MSPRPPHVLAVTILAGLTLCAACEDASPTRPPVAATPVPSPTPTPTPEATPDPNRPPTVTVTNDGGCHPSPGRPCTTGFNATASDPDGDRLAFGWDGCAQGNSPWTTCTITAPGIVTAIVLVDDGRGGVARASATAEGFNQPPLVVFGHPRPPDPAPANTLFSMSGRQPEDPDDDESPDLLCARARIHAAGPCRAALVRCGGMADAFDVDVQTLTGPGTCVVDAAVPDSWGAVGLARLVFRVLP